MSPPYLWFLQALRVCRPVRTPGTRGPRLVGAGFHRSKSKTTNNDDKEKSMGSVISKEREKNWRLGKLDVNRVRWTLHGGDVSSAGCRTVGLKGSRGESGRDRVATRTPCPALPTRLRPSETKEFRGGRRGVDVVDRVPPLHV